MRARRVRYKDNPYTDEWCEKVTIEELNSPDEYGHNLLYTLTSSEHGIDAISKNKILRDKITADGLCLVDENASSPARHLLCSHSGIQLFLDHPELIARLQPSAINAHLRCESMPAIFEVAKNNNGIDLLERPDFRALITKKGLHAQIMHRSFLYLLTRTDRGIALLDDDVLRSKITAGLINLADEYSGESVAMNLCRSERGRQLLLDHPELANMINASVFNMNWQHGRSLLFDLVRSSVGLELLAVSKHLRGLIDINSLNQLSKNKEDRGATPLLYLLSSEQGRAILMKDRRLLKMVEQRDLFARNETDNVSVNELLIRPECAKILAQLSQELRQVVMDYRDNVLDKPISGWHASAMTLFKPQKKSPQHHAEEIRQNKLMN